MHNYRYIYIAGYKWITYDPTISVTIAKVRHNCRFPSIVES